MDAAASRDEQQAISLLAKLAKAPTLASFAMSSGDGMAYCGIHGKLAPVAVRNQEVLQAWFTTLSHGYRLFLAEQKEWANSSPKATVGSLDTLRHLTSHISWCLSSVVADMPHLAQAQFKMQVSRLFVQTGGRQLVLQHLWQTVSFYYCSLYAYAYYCSLCAYPMLTVTAVFRRWQDSSAEQLLQQQCRTSAG